MADGRELESLQAALAKEGAPWQAGITSVSELPQSEKQRLLGVPLPEGKTEADIEREIEANRSAMRALAATAVGAPAAMDWRNVGGGNYVTAVKNQGGCGSCVAFGVLAAMESRLRVQRGSPGLAVDFSEAQLFYCHARAEGRNCGNGWWPDKALDALRDKGVTDEAHYPYTAADQNCSGLVAGWENFVLKISTYDTLSNNAGAMKEFIATNGPIVACLYVYNDFFNYTGGVYRHVSGALAGGHCVCIVGYNDAGGYWIAKNSWGTGWGEAGFFRIAYGECGIGSYGGAYGVTRVLESGWLYSKKVIGLWANNADRNAWVYLSGSEGNLGWRRLAYDSDNVTLDMLTQLSTAKAFNRPVNLYQDNGVIREIYIL
ncbi:Papain family cysteine protease [Calidithermus terrae]|uniref:Papain family cysteine protease n=1 Tax=Calidithermus terrae TaxID=1408545 RepID=A0A399EVX9_9DEIN|nr:C1 family peptidase [Calidithermus terrae]RIH86702.1 Papain family cysteine protease [Calidithermus terrae]